MPRRQAILHLLIIISLGITAYANSFSNEFLYDDEHYIVRNSYIRDFSHLKEIFTKNCRAGAFLLDNFYRPVQILAYSIIYHIFGLNVFGYHLLNLILHTVNVILIYFILLLLTTDKDISFISSLLFMLHPVHTEAVTYINGTADPLAAFFGLLSLFFYLRWDKKIIEGSGCFPTPQIIKSSQSLSANRKNSPTYQIICYFLSVICFIVALMSKETIVILPFLIILIDLYRYKPFRYSLSKYIPYFVLMGCYILIRATIFNFTKSLNLFSESNIYTQNLNYRIFTFLASLTEYYKLLLLPVNLQYDRRMVVYVWPFTPKVLFSALLLVLFLYIIYRSFKTNRMLFLGIGWFFISLVPVSGIIPINGFVMEHWLYLPSIGLLIVISSVLVRLDKPIFFNIKKIGRLSIKLHLLFVLLVAILFGWRIIERNKDWREPIIFYKKVLEHNPYVARVHNNLAMAYADKGMLDNAEKEYNTTIALEDRYPETHHNLALLYLKKGMMEKGIEELKKALAINDTFLYSHITLKEVYEKLEMFEEAKKEANKIDAILLQQKNQK